MNIDVHTHYLPSSVVRSAEEGRQWFDQQFSIDYSVGPKGRLLARAVSEGAAAAPARPLPWDFRSTVADRLVDMDRLRLDLQVLSLTPVLWRYTADPGLAGEMARAVNAEIGGVVRDHPERLAGFASLPLQDADRSIAELERAVRQDGLVGAAVPTHVNGEDWDSERLFPVLEVASSMGALLFFHPAAARPQDVLRTYHLANLIGNPFDTTVAIASLIFGGVLDRLPDLRACFAHGGGYASLAAGRFDHAQKVRRECRTPSLAPSEYLRRLYFDTIVHSATALRALIDQVGVSQVVLGSDRPADMADADPVATIEGNGLLSPAEKLAILGANAAPLLDIGTAA